VGGIPLVIKGEPRGSIISFLVATIWVCFHIEWMAELHTKNIDVQNEGGEPKEQVVLNALRFRTASNSVKSCRSPAVTQCTMSFILAMAVGLFLAGSLTEVIRFTSTFDEPTGCVQSYNLYQLGTSLVSEFSLHGNSVKPQVWILYMAYLLLAIVLPLLVHTVHAMVFILDVKARKLCRIVDVGWTFASAEVLVLSLFVVQVR
jgi:hypothetical protein